MTLYTCASHCLPGSVPQRLRHVQGPFDALCARLEAGFAQVPEAQGMAEIEATIASDRLEQKPR